MSALRQFVSRLRALFRRGRDEAEMSEEMRLHLEMQEEANMAAGISRDEARIEALREFGGLDQVKERYRDERRLVGLEQLAKDFRFAARALAKSPGFTIAVVATLAIGIGATTAIVSFARPVVFPGIPYREPERLVVVTDSQPWNSQAEAPYPFFSFPFRLATIQQTATSFQALGAIEQEQLNLVVRDDPEAVSVNWATSGYFDLAGATADRGRLFLPDEFKGKTGDVAVLSWAVWNKRFGADPGILDHDILLGGKMRRVVGVLSKSFAQLPYFNVADVYLPEELSTGATLWPFRWLQVIGRLKEGTTLAQARAEMAVIHTPAPKGMETTFPKESFRPRLVPVFAYYRMESTYIYWVFLGAVAFLYAIACSNAASLMLARTVARRRELGIRLAMGGSRLRIARLLLAESIILSALSGLIGVLIAQWGYWALTWQQSKGPGAEAKQWALDMSMLATVVAASVLTSVFVVVVPAMRIGRARLSDALKEGAGSLGDSRRLQRLRSGLVITQAALAVTLLVGAGLTLQSFWRLERVNLGFDPANKIAVTGLLPDGPPGRPPEAFMELVNRFRRDLAGLPGVSSVTYSGALPFTGLSTGAWDIKIDGRPDLGEVKFGSNAVSPEYFAALGLPMLAGRGLDGMHKGDPLVAIINETATRQYFKSSSPIGQRLDLGKDGKLEIIGVVGDVLEMGHRQGVRPQFYYPYWQPPVNTSVIIELLRMSAPPALGFEATVRRLAYAADPGLVVTVQPLADNAQQDIEIERHAMLILQVVSALALVLAATGLFAVMAYAVAGQQREFGVRLALGAAPGDLLRLVMRRGLTLAAAGVVIGMGAAWWLTRFLNTVLYETSPHSPATFAVVAVALLIVAAAACWLPARRAASVDPMEALRSE